MNRIYIIPTDNLPQDTGYCEIMAMDEDQVRVLSHQLYTPSEFENEWNDDLNGRFLSTESFVRIF